jgi:hypothetical protein
MLRKVGGGGCFVHVIKADWTHVYQTLQRLREFAQVLFWLYAKCAFLRNVTSCSVFLYRSSFYEILFLELKQTTESHRLRMCFV